MTGDTRAQFSLWTFAVLVSTFLCASCADRGFDYQYFYDEQTQEQFVAELSKRNVPYREKANEVGYSKKYRSQIREIENILSNMPARMVVSLDAKRLEFERRLKGAGIEFIVQKKGVDYEFLIDRKYEKEAAAMFDQLFGLRQKE